MALGPAGLGIGDEIETHRNGKRAVLAQGDPAFLWQFKEIIGRFINLNHPGTTTTATWSLAGTFPESEPGDFTIVFIDGFILVAAGHGQDHEKKEGSQDPVSHILLVTII